MKKQWYYFMFLLLMSYLLVFGVLMFCQGFLLTRDTFRERSSCGSPDHSECIESEQCTAREDRPFGLPDLDNSSLVCQPKRAKVVLLVVDALRYDFAVFDPSVRQPAPYQNKLRVIKDLLDNKPQNTRLYKFVADPPTTTMQRLKALTTGSLPTFIDVGSNFATPEIDEDNLIDQLVGHGENVVFMGDDTWVSLYPNRFKRSWPFPSFNVWDLDTVDEGINVHLYSEIIRPDWSLIVAHYLGVDHCGHRYGPFHKEMARKLTEMNKVIKNVINIVDNDTMVVVIGDHGMTDTGDHGGESDQETSAAMFIYSSRPLVDLGMPTSGTVKQVDLVPTLAAVLGVPIPFSNLGALIPEAMPSSGSATRDLQSALLALWSNVQQTTNYILRYAVGRSEFAADKLQELRERHARLAQAPEAAHDPPRLRTMVRDARTLLGHVRTMCEEVWAQFDSFAMSRGLLLTFLTVFFVYVIVYGMPPQRLHKLVGSGLLVRTHELLAAAAGCAALAHLAGALDGPALPLFLVSAVAAVFAFTFLLVQHWESISVRWYEGARRRRLPDLAGRATLLVTLCALFSNSYVLEEACVLAFLLATLVLAVALSAESRTPRRRPAVRGRLAAAAVAAAALVRLSWLYWRCRPEQRWCAQDVAAPPVIEDEAGARAHCVLALVLLAALVTLVKLWLRACGNLAGLSPLGSLMRYAPTVAVVCLGGYWVLRRFPAASWNTDMLIWTVYALCAGVLAALAMQPLAVHLLPVQDASATDPIPQLFQRVKGMLRRDHQDIPVVYGLGTAYSAAFVAASVVVTLLMALLLGDVLAPSVVIMYATAALVLVIVSVAQYESATTTLELFVTPEPSIVCWVLLSQYFFYGTSHQPSFPSIQWEAAFVGTSGLFTNNVVPAALVTANTFGSHIFFGLTLPLLAVFPVTLYVMFPSLASASSLEAKNIRRGEMLFYENEDELFRSAFTNSCKYLLYHAVRIFACMLSATIHCRHLMVWSIFAPKLIFEVLGLFVTLASVLFGYLLLVRVNSAVEGLVLKLEKRNR